MEVLKKESQLYIIEREGEEEVKEKNITIILYSNKIICVKHNLTNFIKYN